MPDVSVLKESISIQRQRLITTDRSSGERQKASTISHFGKQLDPFASQLMMCVCQIVSADDGFWLFRME